MLHRFFLLPLTLCLTATSLLSFPATEGNEEAVKKQEPNTFQDQRDRALVNSAEPEEPQENSETELSTESHEIAIPPTDIQETIATMAHLIKIQRIQSILPILKALDLGNTVTEETSALFGQNPSTAFLDKPFIFNENENDLNLVRLFIPSTQQGEEGAIVVPFVIPATTKANAPIEDQTGKKKFVKYRAPDNTPTPKENEEIREFFHDAFLFCFKNDDSEALRQKLDTLISLKNKNCKLTVKELSTLVSTLAQEHQLSKVLAEAEQEIATQPKISEPFVKKFNDHITAQKEIKHFSDATTYSLKNYHEALEQLPQVATQAALRTSAAAASSLATGLLAHLIIKQIPSRVLAGVAALTFRPLERELDLTDVESMPMALGAGAGMIGGYIATGKISFSSPAFEPVPQVGAMLGAVAGALISHAYDRSQSKSTLLRKALLSSFGVRPWNPLNQIGVYAYYGWKAGDYLFSASTARAALEKSFHAITLTDLKKGLSEMKTAQASDLATTPSSLDSDSSNSNKLPSMEEGKNFSREKIKDALTFFREQRIKERSRLIQSLEEELEKSQQLNWFATLFHTQNAEKEHDKAD